MKKKGMLLGLIGVVIIGIIGTTYVKKDDIKEVISSAMVKPTTNSQGNITKQSNMDEEEMIKLMEEYGLTDITEAFEKNDYEAMDEFTNNMTDIDYLKMIDMKNNTTDEDYQKMIDIMSKNGYDSMASVLGIIDRGGACH